MIRDDFIINKNDRILITGANGFIGSRVVSTLLNYGFKNIRCFVRHSSNVDALMKCTNMHHDARVSLMKGNLLSNENCVDAIEGVSLVYHLAASTREKTFSGAYENTVNATKNILDAIVIPVNFHNNFKTIARALFNPRLGQMVSKRAFGHPPGSV